MTLFYCRKLRNVLTSRIIRFLSDQAKKDNPKYMRFYEDYGMFLREGIVTTPEQDQRVTIFFSLDCVKQFSGDLFVLCSDLFPMNPEKKDTDSLYLQFFHQRLFLKFSDKRYKFKIPAITGT